MKSVAGAGHNEYEYGEGRFGANSSANDTEINFNGKMLILMNSLLKKLRRIDRFINAVSMVSIIFLNFFISIPKTIEKSRKVRVQPLYSFFFFM